MFHVKHIDDKYYQLLYKLALKSYKKGEIPVGSIVIYNNKVIGKGYNNRQNSKNVCGHAEINAIIQAERKIKDWRLNDCILISTLKPCELCYKVIKESRIEKVYYILDQDNLNYDDKTIKQLENNEYNDRFKLLLDNFFKKLR